MDAQVARPEERWPGEQLGLPESGAGALASWGQRVAALLLDWLACSLLSLALTPVFAGNDVLERGAVLLLFFIETAILTALLGGSFGQLIVRIGIVHLGGGPVGWRAFPRALLVTLVLPALIIGQHRRGLQDLSCNTIVVRRR